MVRRRLTEQETRHVRKRERQQATLEKSGARLPSAEPYRPAKCQAKLEGCAGQSRISGKYDGKMMDVCWPCALQLDPPKMGGYTKEQLIEEGQRLQSEGGGKVRRKKREPGAEPEQADAPEPEQSVEAGA